MNQVVFENISFSYRNSPVIENFSLEVEQGAFTTLLGESGCGKTTLLRLLSGFLKPTSGKILIDGIDQFDIEPNERKVGMVFQDYALFPHLSVRQNILYGLKIQQKTGKIRINLEKELSEVCRILELELLLDRFPHELSGGQQQRVALARALVLKPKILLMDEPLSSLDTKLRIHVRQELKEIQKKLGITTVYVTHDQEEALSLSDKIAVLSAGRLEQYGTPKELYFEPRTRFVADFVGQANFLLENGELVMVRPEWFCLAGEDANSGNPEIHGKILSSTFLGDKTRFTVNLDPEKSRFSVDSKNSKSSKNITVDLDTLVCEHYNVGEDVALRVLRKCKIEDDRDF